MTETTMRRVTRDEFDRICKLAGYPDMEVLGTGYVLTWRGTDYWTEAAEVTC